MEGNSRNRKLDELLFNHESQLERTLEPTDANSRRRCQSVGVNVMRQLDRDASNSQDVQ